MVVVEGARCTENVRVELWGRKVARLFYLELPVGVLS